MKLYLALAIVAVSMNQIHPMCRGSSIYPPWTGHLAAHSINRAKDQRTGIGQRTGKVLLIYLLRIEYIPAAKSKRAMTLPHRDTNLAM